MFGKTPKEKYQHYLDWFANEVLDPSNWAQMRKDQDCANWQTQIEDIDGNLTPLDPGKPVPWDYSMALFKMSDPKKMAKAMVAKKASNFQKYTEMSKYINGDPKQGTFNLEYARNYDTLKAVQQAMKTYSGSNDAAWDEVMALKKECDESGKNFADACENKLNQLKGEHIIAQTKATEPTPLIEPEPQLSLANEFLHLLWKYGFPVGKFVKKKLSVDIANEIGKDKK